MARIARIVVPDLPHHVTQRGNRRQQTFFSDDDYRLYVELLGEHCSQAGVSIWAWCLMPNHVHLMLVPKTPDSLRAALGEAHRRYSRHVNFREGWRGYLWQGRFASAPMDPPHALACARYIELNPVRAKLVAAPEDWPWSSARAHLRGISDGLTQLEPLVSEVGDWRKFLSSGLTDKLLEEIRSAERTGRPLGDDRFEADLEIAVGRELRRKKPGPKPKAGRVVEINSI